MKNFRNLLSMVIILATATLFSVPALAQDPESSASESSPAPSRWSHNFEASLEEASKTHKLVLVDFYTDWCVLCKQLDQTTFADPTLMQYLDEHFIPVKLNAEDKGQGQRLAERNDVTAFPTGVVFAPDGKALGRIFGYFEVPKYKAKLVKFAKKNKHK